MQPGPDYSIFPLGDTALTIDFGNTIDETINRKVLGLFHMLKEDPFPGTIECVPAYSSLTIYYDVLFVRRNNPRFNTAYEAMAEKLNQRLSEPVVEKNIEPRLMRVPVCYDLSFALDIGELAAIKNISIDEIIRIHLSGTYLVYMLGFLPGFTYMGKVEDGIAVPRKTNPRQRVEPGSVGIAGYQTGIYPVASPGGWHIIGRTPLRLFQPESSELTLLKPGDIVQFYSISKDEFDRY